MGSKASLYRWVMVPAMALQVWTLQGCSTSAGAGATATSGGSNNSQAAGGGTTASVGASITAGVDSVASAEAAVTSFIKSGNTQAVLAAAASDAICLGDASQVGNLMLPFLAGCMDANNLADPNGMFSQHGFFGSAGPFNGNAVDSNWATDANIASHFPKGFDPNMFAGLDPNGIFGGAFDPNHFSYHGFDPNQLGADANRFSAGFDPNAIAAGFDPNSLFAPHGSFDPNTFTQFMGDLNNTLGALRTCLDPNGQVPKAP